MPIIDTDPSHRDESLYYLCRQTQPQPELVQAMASFQVICNELLPDYRLHSWHIVDTHDYYYIAAVFAAKEE